MIERKHKELNKGADAFSKEHQDKDHKWVRDKIIDHVVEEFESRSCGSCRYNDNMTTECRHNDTPIYYLDLDCFPDFYCRYWESNVQNK